MCFINSQKDFIQKNRIIGFFDVSILTAQLTVFERTTYSTVVYLPETDYSLNGSAYK